MKKKIFALVATVLLLSGCGKIPTLENGQEAIVTINEGLDISINDLYNELKDTVGLETLLKMIDLKILEKEYADEVEEKKAAAASSMKAMKEYYGDSLLSMVQYYGFSTLEAYEKSIYISSLQNLAIEDYVKSIVTEKEQKKYYDESIFGDITLSHILITTGTTSSSTDAEKTEAEKTAKETINKIIAELKKAENPAERFKELVSEYSEDASTKEKGGSLGSINVGTLDKNYDELLKIANELKEGSYSTTVITTELGYHVIYKESQKEKPTFEDVKDSITETLAENKLAADQTLNVTALEKLRETYGLNIIDSELEKQYKNYLVNKKAEYEQSQKNGN